VSGFLRTKKYGIGLRLCAEDKGNGSACAYVAPKDKGNGSACAYAAPKNKGNGIGWRARAEEKEQELVCACALRKKSTELDMGRAEDKECGSIYAYASLHS